MGEVEIVRSRSVNAARRSSRGMSRKRMSNRECHVTRRWLERDLRLYHRCSRRRTMKVPGNPATAPEADLGKRAVRLTVRDPASEDGESVPRAVFPTSKGDEDDCHEAPGSVVRAAELAGGAH